ncbi:hypothetical protein [Thalassotalea sp. Y01]|uniref:hypothetical protein n=1 Tax=Thalassotalea sp. Y01 TaxID=2729613 RepID=UPI00145E5638|nr:hypothetical protein [Thalassotalea sp. Y01]NMP17638.1 hypothetical protein [Thalassotalea sp. Y01]
MHLSDDQIIEPNALELRHLEHCDVCLQRQQHLRGIRQSLATSFDQDALPEPIWQNIKQAIEQPQQSASTEQQPNNKVTNGWRNLALALAASLVLVVMVPQVMDSTPQQDPVELTLTQLIEQNQLLQSQLQLAVEEKSLSDVQLQMLYFKLDEIDRSLQFLYSQQGAKDEKTALWEKRKQLINKTLSSKKENKVGKI